MSGYLDFVVVGIAPLEQHRAAWLGVITPIAVVSVVFLNFPVFYFILSTQGHWDQAFGCECECYPSLTAHQHQKGHTVPKQV